MRKIHVESVSLSITEFAFLFILVVVKSNTTGTVTDKVKNRLEQLDDFEEVKIT